MTVSIYSDLDFHFTTATKCLSPLHALIHNRHILARGVLSHNILSNGRVRKSIHIWLYLARINPRNYEEYSKQRWRQYSLCLGREISHAVSVLDYHHLHNKESGVWINSNRIFILCNKFVFTLGSEYGRVEDEGRVKMDPFFIFLSPLKFGDHGMFFVSSGNYQLVRTQAY